MKLTFTWNNQTGEGNASKADSERLLEGAKGENWVEVCDFLKDTAFEATELYNRAIARKP